MCLKMLLEGCSIRSTERMTGIHRDTIMHMMVAAGENCQAFLEETLVDLEVDDLECDEVWGFVGMKEKTRQRKKASEEYGDCYVFTAIERTTKLLVTWHVGKRCPQDTRLFAGKLNNATSGRFQLSSDGYTPYTIAIPAALGSRITYGQLVKVYGTPQDGQKRYSPAMIIDCRKKALVGRPDWDRICTSHVERNNLHFRMTVRRMTRLTNGFSKKLENHEAMIALAIAYYNFCWKHGTLNTSPAVAAGLTDHVWTVRELLENAASGALATHS
jgi:IS1 family transposase